MSGQKNNDVEKLLQHALALHRSGAAMEASAAYRAVMEESPEHPEALQLMGVLQLQLGEKQQALSFLERAHALAPERQHICQNYIEACLAGGENRRALAVAKELCVRCPTMPVAHALRARVHNVLGEKDSARRAWQDVLALDPSHGRALTALACDAEERLDWTVAADCYRQLLPLTEQRGAVLCNLGNALLNSGDAAAGRAVLESAVLEAPQEAAAWHNLGRARMKEKDDEGAERAFAEAQRLDPTSLQNALAWLEVWTSAGNPERAAKVVVRLHDQFSRSPEFLMYAGRTALACGQPDEAARCWQQVIAFQPRNALARCNLARLALDERDLVRARKLCEEAVRIDPGLSEAWLNLGLSRHRLDDLAGAMTAYRKVLAISTDRPGGPFLVRTAQINLARALMDAGDFAQAVELLNAAGAEDSREPECFGNYVDALMRVADWRQVQHVLERARRVDGGNWVSRLNPFTVLALTDDPVAQLQAARAYASKCIGAAPPWQATPTRDADEPVRIGYLSSDLHAHATAYLAIDLFESHDRRCFRTYAYSTGPDDRSPMRQRVVAAFDVFHDLRGQSVSAIQKQIRDDGIDILIDLKGHTFRALPEVLSGRPAPLQVSFLGFPGTLGTFAVDYVLADTVLLPMAENGGFDEHPLRLPCCYQPQDRYWQVGAASSRAEHGLPDSKPVLACFNQVYKLTAEVFEDWRKILQAVPDAVLWLLEPGPAARSRLIEQAVAGGVSADRIVFAPLIEHSRHLARIRLADLVLDTFPCGAHTTASDALRQGVPVLTRTGRSFASRVAASLLLHADLPELVADTRSDYVRRAVALIFDSNARKAICERLAAAQTKMADTQKYVRAYEAALKAIWERQRQDLPPAPLHIEADAAE